MAFTRTIALAAGLALCAGGHALAQSKAEIRDMDRNGDAVITRAEWQAPAGAFRLHDTNKDGVLSGTEIWDAKDLRARGRTRDFDDWTARGFARLDRNRDNRITTNEWSYDRQSFRRTDRNRDDIISRAEFFDRRDVAGTSGTITRSHAYHAGYERGQLEGRAAGREDHDRNGYWDLEGQRELETADSGYDTRVGSRTDYQSGYRDGFRAAYVDGWNRR